ncbi:hypothetical protein RST01_11450 [Rummeliibacillus stabekisii]|nr:hypothetical protein RST01_11450 [Rummeliibacillus stabekisii]
MSLRVTTIRASDPNRLPSVPNKWTSVLKKGVSDPNDPTSDRNQGE